MHDLLKLLIVLLGFYSFLNFTRRGMAIGFACVLVLAAS